MIQFNPGTCASMIVGGMGRADVTGTLSVLGGEDPAEEFLPGGRV